MPFPVDGQLVICNQASISSRFRDVKP